MKDQNAGWVPTLGRRAGRIQCMSAFKYPNKNSNIIPIKITPTIPNIQKPSRTENCSTAFLLPLDGQWLCMTRWAKVREVKTKSSHGIPVADCSRSSVD